MKPVSFIASNAEEAVAQIRDQLGPSAVVLNVRPLPPNGLARFWQKPMIEVLAHVPDAPAPNVPEEPAPGALEEFRNELNEIRRHVVSLPATVETTPPAALNSRELPVDIFPDSTCVKSGNWRSGSILQKGGLLPLHAQQLLDELAVQHGPNPPESLADELGLVRGRLAQYWRRCGPMTPNSLHVLVGPSGSGKTTSLCKWLTQTVLIEGRRAQVWRLDSATANMAECLSIYCEILGVRCERVWNQNSGANAQKSGITSDVGFIDLPGVDWRQQTAVKELAAQIKRLGPARVHLVLNGAYETSVLMAQIRAFAPLNIEDLIITHLDEENRWGKLWNLTLGTTFPIRHLSTGQNIPGDYGDASAEKILARQIPCK
jgi:flagellar biosynthesis protein FlhF